jgi:TetR/AcrR family transcriptional regulator, cholesterol catabolism regulator
VSTPAPSRRKPRRAASEPAAEAPVAGARRAALVEIAAGLFAERGYRATTVREIADAAGVLSGSLYHHFDSKESIIDELLSSFLDELLGQYRAITAAGGTATDVLERLVRAAFVTVARHRAAVTVFQNERAYLAQFPRFGYLAKAETSVERLWLKVLRDGMATGEFRDDAEPKIVHRFVRDAIWVSARWYRPTGRLSPDQLADQYLRLFLHGLVTPAA